MTGLKGDSRFKVLLILGCLGAGIAAVFLLINPRGDSTQDMPNLVQKKAKKEGEQKVKKPTNQDANQKPAKQRPEDTKPAIRHTKSEAQRKRAGRDSRNLKKLEKSREESTKESPKVLSFKTVELTKAEKQQEQKENIRATMLEIRPALKKCYEKTLKDFPEASGKVVMGFEISADENGEGRVGLTELDKDQTDLRDQKLHDCLMMTISEILTDPPVGGGSLRVNYPFQFATEK